MRRSRNGRPRASTRAPTPATAERACMSRTSASTRLEASAARRTGIGIGFAIGVLRHVRPEPDILTNRRSRAGLQQNRRPRLLADVHSLTDFGAAQDHAYIAVSRRRRDGLCSPRESLGERAVATVGG